MVLHPRFVSQSSWQFAWHFLVFVHQPQTGNQSSRLFVMAVHLCPHRLGSQQRFLLRWKLAETYRPLMAFLSKAEEPSLSAWVENYRTLLIATTALHENAPLQRTGCAPALYQGQSEENAKFGALCPIVHKPALGPGEPRSAMCVA
jgi:hypothetical protein